MPEDMQFTEQSLREALERLGSRTHKEPSHEPVSVVGETVNQRPYYAGNTIMNGNTAKRRRFVNDGSVLVEHRKDLGRSGRKGAAKIMAERPAHEDRREEILQLQHCLSQERERVLILETGAEDLRRKIRSLETRLAHYQIQLEEREKSFKLLKEENSRLKLRKAYETMKPSVSDGFADESLGKTVRRGRKPKIMAAFPAQSDGEQEPVKWWSED